jgi:hypothetical protein
MLGDPKEYREHAARCAELAVGVRSPQLRAMFLELSKNLEKIAVQLYLKRAANAREKVATAVDETTRKFHQAMEARWMDSAASTALRERVDLFLQTREFCPHLAPSDLCPDCRERMLPKAVEITAELKEPTFRCRNCGSEHTRRFRAEDFLS